MNSILVESPTRVDLAGGTLDLWPLYNFLGGAKTVNFAIDIMTSAELTPLEQGRIELISEDLGLQRSYHDLKACLQDTDAKMKLLMVQLEHWRPTGGFRLRTKSQSPVGGGLGGSSSLTISVLKAFDQAEFLHTKKKRYTNIHDLVRAAHNIEARVLNTPTGTQDYYPAASGGLNCLTYSVDGIQQEVLEISSSEISTHFMLIYTGKSHHSGMNNFEVYTKAVQKDPSTLKHLHELKEISEQTWKVCQERDFKALPDLFKAEFRARVQLAPAFTSPEIQKLHDVSLQAGASAVKICGAGGGGCVLVWVNPAERQRVGEACEKNGFKVLTAKPIAVRPQALN